MRHSYPTSLNFETRSDDRELLDVPDLDPVELAESLKELAVINAALGGYATTLGALSRLVPHGRREFDVLDVGLGGGDTARRIVEWAKRRDMSARVFGIDLAPEAVSYARLSNAGLPGIEFTVQNLFDLPQTRKYDIVHAALLLHHLPDDAAVEALAKMYELCRLGLVINDLHRHPVAYYLIKWLTTLISKNRLILHDAPLSVLRAFHRTCLKDLARRASLPTPDISWHWAFRWSMIVRK
ncbi:MAG: methyltransferase domain-containing protein [Candidatus Riflebacteria bacterium]|nr:methyltransferase domain-containing protein [Candidatus Riflebacteria bacterium]